MFREIAYWTYYFCSKNKFLQKDRMVIPVALMWGSLPLFVNTLTVIYLIGYLMNINILKLIPLQGRYSLISFVIAALEIIPFLIFNYKRYFKRIKLEQIIEKYSKMNKQRRILGKLFYLSYLIFTCYIAYATTTYLPIK